MDRFACDWHRFSTTDRRATDQVYYTLVKQGLQGRTRKQKREQTLFPYKTARNRGDRSDISSPFRIFSLYQKNRQVIHPVDFRLSSMERPASLCFAEEAKRLKTRIKPFKIPGMQKSWP